MFTCKLKWQFVHQSLKLPLTSLATFKSDKIKSIDFHSSLPWLLASLYNGTLTIYDYQHLYCVRAIEVCQLPVRSCKFLQPLSAVVAGCDDLFIRVFNYNTGQRIKAHTDFLRCVIVHPSDPLILSCSDDGTIKIWNYNQNFECVKKLSEHKNFVMQLQVYPRDSSKFASCSLDRTIKIWQISGPVTNSNFTIGSGANAHEGGINCIDFFKGDKPLLASGADDFKIKIWDHLTKQCVVTLEGHQQNISSVCFHPELPALLSTSEDGLLHVYNLNSNALDRKITANMSRAWAIGYAYQNNKILAVAYDEGLVLHRIGREDPTISFNNGKVIFTRNMEAFSVNFKALAGEGLQDNKRHKLQAKEIGSLDFYALNIKHSLNGNLIGLCNDYQFSVYKTQAFKNSKFGSGKDLAWSQGTQFAVREGNQIRVYKNLQIALDFKVDGAVQALYDGPLLGIKVNETLQFHSWDKGAKLAVVPVNPRTLFWNNERVVILTCTSIHVHQVHQGKLVERFVIKQQVHSGVFIEDIFFYVGNNSKVCFLADKKTLIYATVPKRMQLLGYVDTSEKLWFIDNALYFSSITLKKQLVELYGSLIKGQVPENVQEQFRDEVAKVLDAFDKKKEAFRIVKNQSHKFDLAIQLGDIQTAKQIAFAQRSNSKIKVVGDIALQRGDIALAIQAFQIIQDLNSLFLIYSSIGKKDNILSLGEKALAAGKMNMAFQCFYLADAPRLCLNVLQKSKRHSQSCLLARTYLPQALQENFKKWVECLPNSVSSRLLMQAEQEQQEDG